MIIVRYAEIGLKGNNRRFFEKRLCGNIRDCLHVNGISFQNILRVRGRILIETSDPCNSLSFVFGISSFSSAEECSLDIESMKNMAVEITKKKLFTKKTFRVSCRRLEKKLIPSPEIEKILGGEIQDHIECSLDLKHPENVLYIEIMNNHAYLFTQKEKGSGGLPVGVEGHVILLLQNERSVDAGILMMKRGCTLDVVKEQDIDYSRLYQYQYGSRIKEIKIIPEGAIVIVSDTIETFREYPYCVLRPLIAEHTNDRLH